MKTKIGKFLIGLLVLILVCAMAAAWILWQRSAVREDSTASDIEKDADQAVAAFAQSRGRSRTSDGYANEAVNHYRMVANLVSSGICGEKTEAIRLVAEMLFADGKETEFVAGVCGNILCEGKSGLFERDWGGRTQDYLPSRMAGNPYKYDSVYGNKHIYEGFSLSEVYEMTEDLYYSHNWDTGKYMYGLGCVQWTHGRTLQLIEYYIAEAGSSDTITQEQCAAAEMKFIEYELNNTETAAYEHWIAGDHRRLYDDEAARAGYCVAKYYERCHSDYYSMRAERAAQVYQAMMGTAKGTYAALEDAPVEK